ncbi:MAG: hypothetical protein KGQ66_23570 [Acidobacteriota bacterium]|nr:hypothetical protein [Acidobacteriota bacterium]
MNDSGRSRSAPIRAQRQSVSKAKHLALRVAINSCRDNGVVLSAAAITRMAGVTEPFLYRHESEPCQICDEVFGGGPVTYLRSQMTSGSATRAAMAVHEARPTAESLQAELANAKGTIRRLRRQIAALERRLGELDGAQVESNLTETLRLGQDLDPIAEQRLRALHEEQRHLQIQLAERDEELAAVRKLNSELTRRLNKPEA